eukprot:363162-Chlamydomonas_euryale.AAC.1
MNIRQMNSVMKMRKGMKQMARNVERLRRRMKKRQKLKKMAARMPPMMGEKNHDRMMGTNPVQKGKSPDSLNHRTPPQPPYTSAKPMMEP